MRTPGSLAIFATTALVLALAGCSGGPGADKLDYEDSPLNKYLSAAWGGDLSPEEQQKQIEEQTRKQEEFVAECMADEGFEYKPNTQNGGMVFSDDGGEWDPESREWVEKYGYGMVNSPWNEQMAENPPEENTDPNADYVATLSESEQTAFYETLYGAPPEEETMTEGSTYEYNWEDAGCQGAAQHEIQGDDPWQADEFVELRENMEKLWTGTQESPEFKELNAAWASCMADAGEPGFTVQSDASMSISDEQTKIYEAAYGDGTTPPADPENIEDPNKSPEMKKLGEREVELALKDLECRKETSYQEKSLKIQFAQEEKFIAENKADLEAFKAAAEQSK